jgi:alanyl aminopeptidase
MNKALLMPAMLLISLSAYAADDSELDPYRLNSAVQPLNQQLEMTLDPRLENYSGETLISLDVLEDAEFIVLHAQDMTIVSAQFGKDDALEPAEFEQLEHALLRISTGSTIAAGQYQLRIHFEDDFNTDSVSMYRVKEDGRYHIFSQMEASEAREAFPCFDEPAYKIPWNLTLTVPANMMAVSNTPIAESTDQGDMTRVVFAESAPMPSYLIAVAVGEFETVDIPGMSIPGRVVTTLGKSGLTGLAVDSTPKLLAALEAYFDSNYPYQKLDLIATPEFWYGAMENAGAIVFVDRAILIDPDNIDPTRYRSIIGTISHELAHMWFGDVVTMEWWVDLWLNESFASWMGEKIVSRTYPELDTAKAGASSIFKTMDADARSSSRPIRAARKSTDNFLNDIGPAYSKGRSVINMFESAIGEDEFRTGILEYMDRHQWGNATAMDFADAIGVEANFDVPKAFESFVRQPGLPLIEVELLGDGRASVSQQRFVFAGDELPALQWTIPVSLKYSIDGEIHTQDLVLDQRSQLIELKHEGNVQWVYPNSDQRGYYRWKLSTPLLQALLENAQQALNPMERMGLASNLMTMLSAGEIGAEQYLVALESFSSERDPYVMGIVIDQLQTVRDALVSSDQEASFAALVGRLLGPALESYGFDPVEGESNALTSMRPRLLEWMIRDAGNADISLEFEKRGVAFLEDDSDLQASLVPAALMAVAIHGDASLYDQLKQRFENSAIPAERAQLLVGLSYFEDEAILIDLQTYSLSEAFRPREVMSIREELLKRPGPRELVLSYALANYQAFEQKLPGNGLAVLPEVAKSCSLESAERATDFFSQPEHQVSGTLRILDRTNATTRSCAILREREIDNADRYFDARGSIN